MPAMLLLSGSLRAGSTNTAALRAAAAALPLEWTSELYAGLRDLPAFDPDLDGEALPVAAADLRAALRRADALLVCTPEYAGALPGSLKNLLDWTIGDDQPGSIDGKPVAWINVSAFGAAEAHRSLRIVLGYAHARIVEEACRTVPVPRAALGTDGLVADVALCRTLGEAAIALARGAAS